MVKVFKKVSEKYEINVMAVKELVPDALVFDVTIDGAMKKLDPGFRWEGVKVPGRDKEKGLSLKGVYEGLKVFRSKKESDEKWWKEERYLGKERNCKSYGKLMGFDIGKESVGVEKGKEIFEMMYREEVEKRFGNIIETFINCERPVVLLDYMDGDERKIIDHAKILKQIVEERTIQAAA